MHFQPPRGHVFERKMLPRRRPLPAAGVPGAPRQLRQLSKALSLKEPLPREVLGHWLARGLGRREQVGRSDAGRSRSTRSSAARLILLDRAPDIERAALEHRPR